MVAGMNKKQKQRISLGLAGALGSLVLLRSAPGSLVTAGRFRVLRESTTDGHDKMSENSQERSLALRDDEISVTRIDDRTLAVAVNALAEGYYTYVGLGTCVDSHASAREYDYSQYSEVSLLDCANRCGRLLLLNEYRGFNYDASSQNCQCLFDNHRVPLVEERKSEGFDVSLNGDGPVAGANPDRAPYECYKKDTSGLGSAIDSYSAASCGGDASVRDVVTFGAVFTVASCAEHCFRFKLFATHTGFTHQTDQCTCLFMEGEAPTVRKLSGSGAVRGSGRTHSERMNDMSQAPSAVCYNKLPLESASASNRIPVDTNQRVWINEFHYRNDGPNEPFVEIIGPKGTSAADYDLVTYQGRNGMIHNIVPLFGTFESADPSENWGYVVVDLVSTELRKGKQGGDGLALVRRSTNACLQLLSWTDAPEYDRSFLVTEGACDGKATTPIGTLEGRKTPLGYSLQMQGTGNTPSQFAWGSPGPSSRGSVNVGQTLTPP